jgi:hypothetical protein
MSLHEELQNGTEIPYGNLKGIVCADPELSVTEYHKVDGMTMVPRRKVTGNILGETVSVKDILARELIDIDQPIAVTHLANENMLFLVAEGAKNE